MATGDAYREHAPPPALARFVECLWEKRVDADGPRTQRVLPDGCVDLLFELGDGARRGWVIGAMTRPHDVATDAGARYLAVRFRPGGACGFLGRPLAELTDERAPLAELWPAAERLTDELAAAPTAPAAIARLARALEDARSRLVPVDPRVAHALARLVRAPASTRIDALGRELGLSRQHLTKKIKEATGLAPKRLQRVLRLRRLLERLPRGGPASWADAALAGGYADQAHLVAEFRALAGTTPARWAAAGAS